MASATEDRPIHEQDLLQTLLSTRFVVRDYDPTMHPLHTGPSGSQEAAKEQVD